MVYVDNHKTWFSGKYRVHLYSIPTNKEELHKFATMVGIKRCWYHLSRKGVPHYDITLEQQEKAIYHGAHLIKKMKGSLNYVC